MKDVEKYISQVMEKKFQNGPLVPINSTMHKIPINGEGLDYINDTKTWIKTRFSECPKNQVGTMVT